MAYSVGDSGSYQFSGDDYSENKAEQVPRRLGPSINPVDVDKLSLRSGRHAHSFSDALVPSPGKLLERSTSIPSAPSQQIRPQHSRTFSEDGGKKILVSNMGLIYSPSTPASSENMSPLGSSAASLYDDLVLDGQHMEESIRALGRDITPLNYLSQCGLLIKFLVDPDLHRARKKILKKLREKAGERKLFSYVFPSPPPALEKLSHDEIILKNLLECSHSKSLKLKRDAETKKVDKVALTHKLSIIRAEVSAQFPTFTHFPRVSKNLWMDDDVEKRSQEMLCLSHEKLMTNMATLSNIFEYLLGPDGITVDEITAPCCDFTPDFKVPFCPWDKKNGEYFVPIHINLVVDGEAINIPQEDYKELASRVFIRMREGKAFALSSRENWDTLSSDTQKLIVSQLNDDENSLCSDAYRFDCIVQRYLAPELPLLPVLSTGGFGHDYQETVKAKAKELAPQIVAPPATKKSAKGADPALVAAEREVKRQYLYSDAAGQQLASVLLNVMKQPDQVLQLVTGCATQGALNEIYLYSVSHLFPKCEIAVHPTDRMEAGETSQASKGHLEINDWGDGKIEILSYLHYGFFKASDNDRKLYKGDTYFTIKILAVCDGQDVTVSHVEMNIDIKRVLSSSHRKYLLSKNKEFCQEKMKRVKFLDDLDSDRGKDSDYVAKEKQRISDKFEAARSAQESYIVDQIISDEDTVSEYVIDSSEQKELLEILHKSYETERKKKDALREKIKKCQSVKRFGFGICRRLPEYICDVRKDSGGDDLSMSEDACRLIYTEQDGWVVTNVAPEKTSAYERPPTVLQRFMSKDNLNKITICQTDDETLDEQEEPSPHERMIASRTSRRITRSMRLRDRSRLLVNCKVDGQAQVKLAKALNLSAHSRMILIMGQLTKSIPADTDRESYIKTFCEKVGLSEKQIRQVRKYAHVYYQNKQPFSPESSVSPTPALSLLSRRKRAGSVPHLAMMATKQGQNAEQYAMWRQSYFTALEADPVEGLGTGHLLSPIKDVVTPHTTTSLKKSFSYNDISSSQGLGGEELLEDLMHCQRVQTDQLAGEDGETELTEEDVVSDFAKRVYARALVMRGDPRGEQDVSRMVNHQGLCLRAALMASNPGNKTRIDELMKIFDQKCYGTQV